MAAHVTQKNRTGVLLYNHVSPNGDVAQKSFNIWVTQVQQPLQLNGVTAQSALTRHFYPRSYGPGDYLFTGISPNQAEYQKLAVFIRQHQEYLMSSFAGRSPILNSDGTTVSVGSHYQGLLRIHIPNEQIQIDGWVGRFTVSKYGVFDPAPQWQFNFVVARDQNSNNASIPFGLLQTYLGTDIVDALGPPTNSTTGSPIGIGGQI